ncbi:V-type proton ATPase subunit S1-like [Discoglossus pictus]
MMPNSAVLLCLLYAIFPEVTSRSHVPVVLWSTQSSMWESEQAISDGHIIERHELHMLLQPAITPKPNNIVMFLQDTLSIDDFTYYSSGYGSKNPMHNIQDILNLAPSSLVLPAVNVYTVDSLLTYLKSEEDWNIIHIDNPEVSSVEVEASVSNLIIVELQPIPRSNDKAAAEIFSANGEQIGRIVKDLTERGIKFTAIYTGLGPSKVFATFDMAPKLGRHLLSTATTGSYPPLNVTGGTTNSTNSTDNCIVFYATQILLTTNGTNLDLTNQTFGDATPNTTLSYCSSNESVLSLVYDSPGLGIDTLELRFIMSNMFYPGSARNWFKIETIQIIRDNITATFDSTYASAPAEYSFHCQQMGTSQLYGEILVPNKDTPEAKNWHIFLSEFQIQGFNVKDSTFSYASDCTGFFSAGIWMGLVSCLVLLWILAYGVFMIMQLTTNDRFDDPKSPALSVPQTE